MFLFTNKQKKVMLNITLLFDNRIGINIHHKKEFALLTPFFGEGS